MSTALARRVARLECALSTSSTVVLIRRFAGPVVGIAGPGGTGLERQAGEPLAELHRRAFDAAARLQTPFIVLTERTH